MNVRYEWLFIVGAGLAALIVFLACSAEASLKWGWFFMLGGLIFTIYMKENGSDAGRARGTPQFAESVSTHRVEVVILTACILIGVIGIEVGIKKTGGVWGNPWFFILHLSLSICMAAVFLFLRFKHTGLRQPHVHRRLGYVFLTFYAAAFASGTVLINEKYPFFDPELAANVTARWR